AASAQPDRLSRFVLCERGAVELRGACSLAKATARPARRRVLVVRSMSLVFGLYACSTSELLVLRFLRRHARRDRYPRNAHRDERACNAGGLWPSLPTLGH